MDSQVFFQLLLPGLTTGCVYALVALGFVLTANVSGVVNFAQGEFVMLGGIVAAALVAHGVPLGARRHRRDARRRGRRRRAGAPDARAGAQTRRISSASPSRSASRSCCAASRSFCSARTRCSCRASPATAIFTLFGAVLPIQSLWVWVATAALLAATFWFLKFTDTGRAVRACSINLRAARLMGVNAERLTLLVFALAGGTGALAGVVITPIVLANWDAGVAYGLKGFIGAILGGLPLAARSRCSAVSASASSSRWPPAMSRPATRTPSSMAC